MSASSRVGATFGVDARLSVRHGFVLVGIVVAAFWVVVIGLLPRGVIEAGIAVFVFLNLLVTTFYFVAGWVLYEKNEGSIEALSVTPLRHREYLGSKLALLSALGLAECLAIVLLTYGSDVRWGPAAAGGLLTTALYTLAGFVMVVRYDSINEFLMPSTVLVILLQLPVLYALGVWESPLFLLFPTHAALRLLAAGFGPVESWEIVYGGVYGSLWVWLLLRRGESAYQRLVLRRQGERR